MCIYLPNIAYTCEYLLIFTASVIAHKANLSSTSSHLESVKMTTVKEVGVHRAEETTTASSRRRPLVMTPSMEEADEKEKL